MSLTFSNGYQQGEGYVDSPSQSQLTTLTGTTTVGENFTVSGGNKVVTSINLHLVKAGSPPAALTVKLVHGATTDFTVSMPASQFSTLY